MDEAGLLRHLDQTGIKVVFAMPAGPALTRSWSWRQIFSHECPDWIFFDPPPWLEDGEVEWHDPLLPIEFRGRVRIGMEDHARAWVFSDVE